MDIRIYSKGQYNTDFRNIRPGASFPSTEVRARNLVYRSNKRLFTGEYASNKKLIARIDGNEEEVDYKVLPLNYFKLIVNKIDSLLWSNDVTIHTGNSETDNLVNKLIERTGWLDSIRYASKLAEIYGDVILKTYTNGVSVCPPMEGYKVLDKTDKSVKGFVLKELLYEDQMFSNEFNSKPSYIRILISCPGFDYERVFRYSGDYWSGTLGEPVRIKYKDRWIPKRGRYYFSGVDEPTVQWFSVNIEDDGVYGTSSFENVKKIIWALENRLTMDNYVLDAHGMPILLIGQSAVIPDEKTKGYKLKVIDNKFLIARDINGEPKASYLTWDGKLENSKTVRDDLLGHFYELSEMGKVFLSGQVQGNPSEETLGNIIKSAIDRGHREINYLYTDMKKSLYVLCRLNNIDIRLEDISIELNIGRADDAQVLAKVCETLLSCNLFSKETLRKMYYGYDADSSKAEDALIQKEGGGDLDDIQRDSGKAVQSG